MRNYYVQEKEAFRLNEELGVLGFDFDIFDLPFDEACRKINEYSSSIYVTENVIFTEFNVSVFNHTFKTRFFTKRKERIRSIIAHSEPYSSLEEAKREYKHLISTYFNSLENITKEYEFLLKTDSKNTPTKGTIHISVERMFRQDGKFEIIIYVKLQDSRF